MMDEFGPNCCGVKQIWMGMLAALPLYCLLFTFTTQQRWAEGLGTNS